MKVYDNIHEAFLGTLADVFDNPEHRASPRGQGTREILDYQFRILNPKPETIVTKDSERNIVIELYTLKETELYNSMTNSVEDFVKASKFWAKLANPDGTVNSGYGYRLWKYASLGNPYFEKGNDISQTEYFKAMRTPWDWAKLCLRKDKDTRQALIRFSLQEDQWDGNKDQVCTMYGIFSIRNDKLNLAISMRSNDLTLGLTYDLPWFISLMYKMVDELKDVYPELQVGHYTHNVNSLHIYDRDEQKILKMLGRQ